MTTTPNTERKASPNSVATPSRHWGDTTAPMTQDQVLASRPILGTGKVPPELERMRDETVVRVVTADAATKPTVTVDRVADGHWQIAIAQSDGQRVEHPAVQKVEMLDPERLRAQIDPNVHHSAYRPDWVDVMYQPRTLDGPERPQLTRLDGRRKVNPLFVWGADDRKVYKDTSWPWHCVGKLFTSDGYVGSASLVGPNLIVTAGHMLPLLSTLSVPFGTPGSAPLWMRFVPDYYDGQSLLGAGVSAYVTHAGGIIGSVSGYDYAICKLDKPLGTYLGYFGFNGWSTSWEGQPRWSCAGYPADVAGGQRPSRQSAISIHDTDGDSNGGQELESQNADINHGNSGGPLFGWFTGGDPRLIGVVSGEESEYHLFAGYEPNNVFAGGPGFTDLIAWGRTHW